MSAGAAPTCLACHYAVTGVPTPRCPECGGAFNPADPSTFGPLSRTRQRVLFAAIHLGRVLALCVLAFAIYRVIAYAMPRSLFAVGHAIYLAMLLAAVSLPVLIALLLLHARTHGPRSLATRRAWAVHVLLFTPLLAPIALATGLGWSIRWSLTHSALQAVAAGSRPLTPHQTYGVTAISAVQRYPDGTIQLDLAGPIRWSNPPPQFRFGPSAAIPSVSHPRITQLSNGWWLAWSDT
jgi:hypothetical protein